MTTEYVCSVCRTPVTDVSVTSCSNCHVDFTKVGPTPVVGDVPAAVGPTIATVPPDSGGWQRPSEQVGRPRGPWYRRHWRVVLMVILVPSAVVAVALSLVSAFGPGLRAASDIVGESGGRISAANFATVNGATSFTVVLAAGVPTTDASVLACTVVTPTLARDGFAGVAFQIIDRAGDVLANDRTGCANPAPTQPVLNGMLGGPILVAWP